MLSKKIFFKNFISKGFYKKRVKKLFSNLIQSPNQILYSLDTSYKDSFDKKFLSKFKKNVYFRLIGIGGSILGAKAIYYFLSPKKKKFKFFDNFSHNFKKDKKKNVNLIISKSGNTLETISNANVLINHNEKNIFLTEQKNSYLTALAKRLKSEVIYHNNYIGGRYSVLSEVGMLPAHFMGYKPEKFRKFNHLIKNKKFVEILIQNVANILYLRKKKTNSIIINYDSKSNELFKWYQQLVAESLGKKSKGILPIISFMPQDNHSLMQYYLDGVKNNFFTLFFFKEKNSTKIKDNKVFKIPKFLRNKKLNDISYSQFLATERVFRKKNIPFRSFVTFKRDEETLGELFTFFILETILLGLAMNINPFDQPSVELIKKETKKILI